MPDIKLHSKIIMTSNTVPYYTVTALLFNYPFFDF